MYMETRGQQQSTPRSENEATALITQFSNPGRGAGSRC
ncbi:hypothetical protein FM113_09825 [Leucobacter sp. 7(1)]|nr:hypothetical protein FM113_09825 [Leucobacter sp. 7(1)]